MIFLLRQRSSLALVLLALSSLNVFGADNWHVPEALVRYQLTLTSKPTHPTCGYFVNLPDAGGTIASTMNATTSPVVITPDGTEISSRVLWAGAQNGISLVFGSAPQNTNSVFVYMKKGLQPKLFYVEVGVHPKNQYLNHHRSWPVASKCHFRLEFRHLLANNKSDELVNQSQFYPTAMVRICQWHL